MKVLAKLLILGLIQTSALCWAQADEPIQTEPLAPLADHFYTVYEAPAESSKNTFQNPLEMGEKAVAAAKAKVLSLLHWKLRNGELKAPKEKYMRKLHFGRWINDPTDDTCMNTRAKVLVRDSHADVTFKAPRQCVVESGDWTDPYTGDEIQSAKDIQVDHMVPLKHAYQMGAWKWDYKGRCLYANFMGYKNHLVSAGAHENMSKGDSSPAEYMPPRNSYQCSYLKSWLTVKLIWKLAMTEEEVEAITDIVKSSRCPASSMTISLADLNRTRKFIKENLNFCLLNRR